MHPRCTWQPSMAAETGCAWLYCAGFPLCEDGGCWTFTLCAWHMFASMPAALGRSGRHGLANCQPSPPSPAHMQRLTLTAQGSGVELRCAPELSPDKSFQL